MRVGSLGDIATQKRTYMDIYNIDTGKTHTLRMIDPQTGIDFVADWMGRIETSNLHWNEEEDRLEGDQAEIDWWIYQMGAHQAAYDHIAECKQAYGPEAVDDVLSQLEHCDFEQQPNQVIQALEARFGIVRPIKLF
jgi:hypothetical protein